MGRYLILGQGLSGTLVADALETQGHDVTIIERPRPRSASKVSAGMIDPISGQRFALSWQYQETVAIAVETYTRLETEIRHPIIASIPIWRLFRDETDQSQYIKKKAVISAYIAGPAPDHPAIHAPLGGVLVQGGYRVDVARIIDYFRQKWTMSNQLYNELNAVPYPLKDYSRIIDCTGPYQAINTELKGLPSRVSRGECLIFEADMALDAIINNGHWLLPLGNNRFKFGATYQWEDCFGIPQKSGYEFLSEKLETLIPRVPVRILAYEAGTRNIMCDTRAIVGPHPSDASRWVVGGVGSKGTQLLPFIAQHLVHVLESRAPLHPELDIRRFNRAET